MNPLARKHDIFPENLPEEIVLYDKLNNRVHCLNKIATVVWESCDGTRTIDDLAHIVEAKFGAPAERDLVLQALAELEKADLLESGSEPISEARLTSRREAVGKFAMVASAMVATIVAAAPKAHASLKGPSPPPPPNK